MPISKASNLRHYSMDMCIGCHFPRGHYTESKNSKTTEEGVKNRKLTTVILVTIFLDAHKMSPSIFATDTQQMTVARACVSTLTTVFSHMHECVCYFLRAVSLSFYYYSKVFPVLLTSTYCHCTVN